ncbi:glutamate racemase [Holospora obtusa F1]|uniref:Glutamate racemase n=1 Tax=Holospora obtusa F1 TaxID=1399147 RepID=W6TE15_HOLOB|nr:aspartate/glutamate racemase family protein [Holospora obtusa]ETZ07126.1 glutamate racemase [Holospora obtusa F1]
MNLSFASSFILKSFENRLQDVFKYPIGIYDSGLGGLNVLLALYNVMPTRCFVYFADLRHMPYGNRSSDSIAKLSKDNVKFLEKQGCSIIVSACHTSTTCLSAMNIVPSKHFVSMEASMYAIIQEAVIQNKISEVTILATQRTIDSYVYQNYLYHTLPDLKVRMIACPSWVIAIESQEENKKRSAVFDILPDIKNSHAIVYGCTHFSEMDKILEEELPFECLRLDPNLALAKALKEQEKTLPLNDVEFNHQICVFTNVSFAPQLENFLKQFPKDCAKIEYVSEFY